VLKKYNNEKSLLLEVTQDLFVRIGKCTARTHLGLNQAGDERILVKQEMASGVFQELCRMLSGKNSKMLPALTKTAGP